MSFIEKFTCLLGYWTLTIIKYYEKARRLQLASQGHSYLGSVLLYIYSFGLFHLIRASRDRQDVVFFKYVCRFIRNTDVTVHRERFRGARASGCQFAKQIFKNDRAMHPMDALYVFVLRSDSFRILLVQIHLIGHGRSRESDSLCFMRT